MTIAVIIILVLLVPAAALAGMYWQEVQHRDAWKTAYSVARWEPFTRAEQHRSGYAAEPNMSDGVLVAVRQVARVGDQYQILGQIEVAKVKVTGQGWTDRLEAAQLDAASKADDLNATVVGTASPRGRLHVTEHYYL